MRLGGICDAKFSSVWKIWPSTEIEMPSVAFGKLRTKDLEEMCRHLQYYNDGNIYALDRARVGTRSEPLPKVLPKFLSSQSRSVHAE